MAKNSDASFFESHIEKIVLGICVVLLAIVAVYWIPSSPRQVSVISRNGAQVLVSPAQADAELLAGAQAIRKRNNDAVVTTLPAVRFVEKITLAAARPFSLPLELPDIGIPGRTLNASGLGTSGTTIAQVTLSDLLAGLPAPAKPVGWSGFEMPKPAANQPLVEKITYHGTALYPWSKLDENLGRMLVGVSPLPVILGMEVQVREVLSEGFGPETTPNLVGSAGVGKLSDFNGGNGGPLTKELEALGKQQRRSLVADYPDIYDVASRKFVNWQTHLDIGGEPNLLAKTQPTDKMVSIPDISAQMQAGKIVMAFHDNSLQMDHSYSYRVRMLLSNPLLGLDASSLKDPKDAYVKDMKTTWSDWSDPILVRNPTEFFVTGPGPNPSSVQVTIFTRKLGQLVMLKNLLVEPGHVIGRNVKMMLPTASGDAESDVDFSTGCVAVDVEDRHSTRTTGLGSKIVTTQALLLVNAKGELEWRILSEDLNSKRLKELYDKKPLPADIK